MILLFTALKDGVGFTQKNFQIRTNNCSSYEKNQFASPSLGSQIDFSVWISKLPNITIPAAEATSDCNSHG